MKSAAEIDAIKGYSMMLDRTEKDTSNIADALFFVTTDFDMEELRVLSTSLNELNAYRLVNILTEIIKKKEQEHKEQEQKTALQKKVSLARRQSRYHDICGLEDISSALVINDVGISKLLAIGEGGVLYPLNKTGEELHKFMGYFIIDNERGRLDDMTPEWLRFNKEVGRDSRCLLGYHDGKLSSFLIYVISHKLMRDGSLGSSRSIMINKVFTKRSKRRRGFFTCMFRQLEQILAGLNSKLKAGETPVKTIELCVYHENASAIRQYERVGFLEEWTNSCYVHMVKQYEL